MKTGVNFTPVFVVCHLGCPGKLTSIAAPLSPCCSIHFSSSFFIFLIRFRYSGLSARLFISHGSFSTSENTDPEAKRLIDRFVHRPEFEFYDDFHASQTPVLLGGSFIRCFSWYSFSGVRFQIRAYFSSRMLRIG